MMTKQAFLALALAVLVAQSGYAAHAAVATTAIGQAETGVFIGVGQTFQHETDTIDLKPIDSENGTLAAYTVGLMGIDRHVGGLYWRLGATVTTGSSHYQGDVHMGLPAQASTSQRLDRIAGRLGLVINGPWWHDSRAVFAPYVGFGFQRWARDIADGSLPGGQEYTSDGHIGLGLHGDYALARHWVIAIWALTGYTVGAQVSGTDPVAVNTATGEGRSASATEALGDRPYRTVGATIIYLASRRWRIAVRIRRARWAYGESAPIPIVSQSGAVLGEFTDPGCTVTQTLVALDVRTVF
ncbi:MAG TPA: hypothetical protein VMV40_01850 [Acidiferrobacter sp.]|nr:hypothetical protein [Acidiferrobacter sp.]